MSKNKPVKVFVFISIVLTRFLIMSKVEEAPIWLIYFVTFNVMQIAYILKVYLNCWLNFKANCLLNF